MTSVRHPRVAKATPKAPEAPTEPTSAPILSTTSPKEMRPTPVLTQARSVRSLARCSLASVPPVPPPDPSSESTYVHLHFMPGVVDVAFEVPYASGILRWSVGGQVQGPDDDLILTGVERYGTPRILGGHAGAARLSADRFRLLLWFLEYTPEH